MDIPKNQRTYIKKIGKIGTKGVYGIGGVGGIHLIAVPSEKKDGSFETIGAGSHPAVARFIAKKRTTNLEFTDLNKSEDLSPRIFTDQIPLWENVTDQIRDIQKIK